MKLDISELTYEAKDYEFDGATLSIRPLIMSRQKSIINDEGLTIKGENRFEDFNYCLVGWKGVTDANGEDLPCTEEIKKKVFDFGLGGIATFVLEKARVFKEEKEDLEKN